MVLKRPASPSGDEDDAKRAKRSASDASDVKKEVFPLRGLPLELKQQIYLAAASDADGARSFFKTLEDIAATHRQARAEVHDLYIGHPKVESFRATAKHAFSALDKAASTVNIAKKHKDICLLPTFKKARRDKAVSGLFNGDDLEILPPGVGVALVGNVKYVDPARKPALLGYVKSRKDLDAFPIDPFMQALENLEDFEPEQIRELVAISLEVPDFPPNQRLYSTLASKIGALAEADQLALITKLGSRLETQPFLTNAAGRWDALTHASRAALADHICRIGDDEPHKWTAMGRLAKQFDDLSTTIREQVSWWISSGLEPINNMPPVHVADFHLLDQAEAAHQLSLHEQKLPFQQSSRLHDYIQDIVNAPQGQKLPLKAILITHLRDEERPDFVQNSLRDAPGRFVAHAIDRTATIVGLAFRVRDLSDKEKGIYVDRICKDTPDHMAQSAIEKIVELDWDVFSPRDHDKLIDAGLSGAQAIDTMSPSNFLRRVARKASPISHEAVKSVMESLNGHSDRLAREAMPYRSQQMQLLQHMGLAARCFGDWASEQISMIFREQENGRVPGEDVTSQRASRSPPIYDERAREDRAAGRG